VQVKKEEPEEEIAEKTELDEEKKEELRDQILNLLKDKTDGLRMVEIADILGIANWRSLIPIMKELLDEDEIRKDDSTYYA